MNRRGIPSWIKIWFLVSSVVCSYDASFILLRPHSIPPNGKYSSLYTPYILYSSVDAKYVDLEDTFVVGQTWCNLAEIVAMLWIVFFSSRSNSKGWIASLVVSVMTFWKTVVYMIQYTDLCNGSRLLRGSDPQTVLFAFIIPNGLWIVMSFFVMMSTWNHLSSVYADRKDKGE